MNELRVVGVVGVPIVTPDVFEERRSGGVWFWFLPFGIGIPPVVFFIRNGRGCLSDSVVSSSSESSSSESSLSVRDPWKASWVADAEVGIARNDDPAEGIEAREAD